MVKDSRVTSAISHWAPRFVSNGVMLADFEEVTASIERWEDWCAAWSARAKMHEDLAKESLNEGHRLTAGEHFVRAAMYYHFAKFVFVQDPLQMRAAHIELERDVYFFAGIAPPEQYQSSEPAFSKAIQTFRQLTRAEAESVRANRIDLYTVRQGDTWQSIAERASKGLVKATTLAIMNDHAVADQPSAGERIKIVVAG